jgi:hypothetical protein
MCARAKSISANAPTIIFLHPNFHRVTKFFLSFFLCFFFIGILSAQTNADSSLTGSDTLKLQKVIPFKDSVIKHAVRKRDFVSLKKDTVYPNKPDTLPHINKPAASSSHISKSRIALLQNPDFNFLGKIQSQNISVHAARSSDGLFYLILGLCFYFAFLRLFFSRYVSNLVSLFFRASMRQQQLREQAQQATLPSLLLNILFILTSGLYACFIIRYYQFAILTPFWLLLIYCVMVLGAVYVARFCILKLFGWVFSITRAADNYIFIVFMISKIAGFALLPFLILVYFSDTLMVEIAMTVSMVMIAIFYIYRVAACYASLRSEIKLSLFHYFIYLCAFEIAPLLLIYKVVLTYLKKAY